MSEQKERFVGFSVCEGVESYWHYHLCPSDDITGTKSLCGKRTMSSLVPILSWGLKMDHMPSSYCSECSSIAENTEDGLQSPTVD